MPSSHRNHPATPDEARRATLVVELSKLDPDEERALAEEGSVDPGETTDDLPESIG